MNQGNKLSRQFVDADAEIEQDAQMSIPEIFIKHGEKGFRALETKILSKLGKQSGLVIATGGGCVTKAENFPLLHQNGTIVWIQRDTSKLPTEGRPLSKIGKIEEMYSIRKPLYQSFSDFSVSNNCSIEETIAQIMKGFGKI